MKNNELIETLKQFDGNLPVEFMANCSNEKCGAIFSTDIGFVGKSERLADDGSGELEGCVVLTEAELEIPQTTNKETALIALLSVKDAIWEYYRALDARENANIAAGKLAEEIEALFGSSWHQGITEKDNADN